MSKKSLSQIERDVLAVSDIYAERFEIERGSAWYLAKLTEELGELTAADLKCAGNARSSGKSRQDLEEDLADEAADLFAHILLFCRNRNIDLEQALERKWLKHLPVSQS
ncbi:pyrophosphatase [Roseibium sp. SCP14]|uniref:pyrophosphatase n=1 Tax=Roseibium sp. SCP14 TaxID=3141375 RepID=UPI003338BA25